MIDGAYPSQLVEIQAMRSSHYRNLKNIFNKNSHRLSFPSPDFLQMSRRKKVNHQNWRIFNYFKNEDDRFKKNYSLYQKLQNISNKKSRYSLKTQPNESRDSLLHHNYIYECNRRFDRIQYGNSLLASRIIQAKSNISHKKQEKQYQNNRFNVSRLQKFQRFKRLNRIVNKSFSSKISARENKISNLRIRTICNPQSLSPSP